MTVSEPAGHTGPKLLYLDSSAIVKLIVREPETAALFKLLRQWPDRISSVVAKVEVQRALLRSGCTASVRNRGQKVLNRITLLRLDDGIVSVAGNLDPPELRALDAVHLASALSIRGDVAAIVTYDLRLARAASKQKIEVWSPA